MANRAHSLVRPLEPQGLAAAERASARLETGFVARTGRFAERSLSFAGERMMVWLGGGEALSAGRAPEGARPWVRPWFDLPSERVRPAARRAAGEGTSARGAGPLPVVEGAKDTDDANLRAGAWVERFAPPAPVVESYRPSLATSLLARLEAVRELVALAPLLGGGERGVERTQLRAGAPAAQRTLIEAPFEPPAPRAAEVREAGKARGIGATSAVDAREGGARAPEAGAAEARPREAAARESAKYEAAAREDAAREDAARGATLPGESTQASASALALAQATRAAAGLSTPVSSYVAHDPRLLGAQIAERDAGVRASSTLLPSTLTSSLSPRAMLRGAASGFSSEQEARAPRSPRRLEALSSWQSLRRFVEAPLEARAVAPHARSVGPVGPVGSFAPLPPIGVAPALRVVEQARSASERVGETGFADPAAASWQRIVRFVSGLALPSSAAARPALRVPSLSAVYVTATLGAVGSAVVGAAARRAERMMPLAEGVASRLWGDPAAVAPSLPVPRAELALDGAAAWLNDERATRAPVGRVTARPRAATFMPWLAGPTDAHRAAGVAAAVEPSRSGRVGSAGAPGLRGASFVEPGVEPGGWSVEAGASARPGPSAIAPLLAFVDRQLGSRLARQLGSRLARQLGSRLARAFATDERVLPVLDMPLPAVGHLPAMAGGAGPAALGRGASRAASATAPHAGLASQGGLATIGGLAAHGERGTLGALAAVGFDAGLGALASFGQRASDAPAVPRTLLDMLDFAESQPGVSALRASSARAVPSATPFVIVPEGVARDTSPIPAASVHAAPVGRWQWSEPRALAPRGELSVFVGRDGADPRTAARPEPARSERAVRGTSPAPVGLAAEHFAAVRSLQSASLANDFLFGPALAAALPPGIHASALSHTDWALLSLFPSTTTATEIAQRPPSADTAARSSTPLRVLPGGGVAGGRGDAPRLAHVAPARTLAWAMDAQASQAVQAASGQRAQGAVAYRLPDGRVPRGSWIQPSDAAAASAVDGLAPSLAAEMARASMPAAPPLWEHLRPVPAYAAAAPRSAGSSAQSAPEHRAAPRPTAPALEFIAPFLEAARSRSAASNEFSSGGSRAVAPARASDDATRSLVTAVAANASPSNGPVDRLNMADLTLISVIAGADQIAASQGAAAQPSSGGDQAGTPSRSAHGVGPFDLSKDLEDLVTQVKDQVLEHLEHSHGVDRERSGHDNDEG